MAKRREARDRKGRRVPGEDRAEAMERGPGLGKALGEDRDSRRVPGRRRALGLALGRVLARTARLERRALRTAARDRRGRRRG